MASFLKSAIRNRRYTMLRRDGLTGQEARLFSKVTMKSVVLQAVRAARLQLRSKVIKEAVKQGLGATEYKKLLNKRIKNQYIHHGWKIEHGLRKGKISPWAMYRYYEHLPGIADAEYERLKKAAEKRRLKNKKVHKAKVAEHKVRVKLLSGVSDLYA